MKVTKKTGLLKGDKRKLEKQNIFFKVSGVVYSVIFVRFYKQEITERLTLLFKMYTHELTQDLLLTDFSHTAAV